MTTIFNGLYKQGNLYKITNAEIMITKLIIINISLCFGILKTISQYDNYDI